MFISNIPQLGESQAKCAIPDLYNAEAPALKELFAGIEKLPE